MLQVLRRSCDRHAWMQIPDQDTTYIPFPQILRTRCVLTAFQATLMIGAVDSPLVLEEGHCSDRKRNVAAPLE